MFYIIQLLSKTIIINQKTIVIIKIIKPPNILMSFCKKTEILKRFNENVRGLRFCKQKGGACGDEGHWLEKRMGIVPNCDNCPIYLDMSRKKNQTLSHLWINKPRTSTIKGTHFLQEIKKQKRCFGTHLPDQIPQANE